MAATYFHKVAVGTDLSGYLAIHQQQFPGNELAVLDAADGNWIVKVAYPDGTALPAGALARSQALSLLKVVSLG